MKFIRVLFRGLLGAVALAVLLYVVAVLINWRDQPPSVEALELKKVVQERPPVADADNGYIYMLGFSAPREADPQSVGMRRAAWVMNLRDAAGELRPDPAPERVDFKAAESTAAGAMRESCRERLEECRLAFEAKASSPLWTDDETLELNRYRDLLRHSAWREPVPLDLSAPLPAFADELHAQRLLFVHLRQLAGHGKTQEIADSLRADLVFWRTVLDSTDYLISKMIAVAALRQHFFFGNLVLRQLPANQALNAVPDAWTVALSNRERSLRRVLAGELAFEAGLLRTVTNSDSRAYRWEQESEHSILPPRLVYLLAKPLYQPQDLLNRYAARHLAALRFFDVPLDQYARAAARQEQAQPEKMPARLYNLIGDNIARHDGGSTYQGYFFRVGSVEGMRRAALLTVQLRAAAVSKEQVAGELRAAKLRDPFTNEPFEWDAKAQAVVYIAPEADAHHRRQSYFY